MYVVVICVLSVVLAMPTPPFNWLTRREHIYAGVAIAALLPPLVAWFFARRAVAQLDALPEDPSRGQMTLGRGMLITPCCTPRC